MGGLLLDPRASATGMKAATVFAVLLGLAPAVGPDLGPGFGITKGSPLTSLGPGIFLGPGLVCISDCPPEWTVTAPYRDQDPRLRGFCHSAVYRHAESTASWTGALA
jgi:hypothetical protein